MSIAYILPAERNSTTMLCWSGEEEPERADFDLSGVEGSATPPTKAMLVAALLAGVAPDVDEVWVASERLVSSLRAAAASLPEGADADEAAQHLGEKLASSSARGVSIVVPRDLLGVGAAFLRELADGELTLRAKRAAQFPC